MRRGVVFDQAVSDFQPDLPDFQPATIHMLRGFDMGIRISELSGVL
jgi:hypothetical protein